MSGSVDDRRRGPVTPAAFEGRSITTPTDELIVQPRYGRRPVVLPLPPEWTPARGCRLRRDAARRVPPLANGCRDPLDDKATEAMFASTLRFGLSIEQARAEWRRLSALGWSRDELEQLFGVSA